ncbi:hypothetical protein [Halapricum hydrolyticum]|uniref:Uncharacterized protein n=1 Tax=Halapricum hydrolyticum TaxID=2979991 RepID=A0AAE3IBP4_9EURY|nr:hypothetical protein [Halapricum hydrolyticum]MCU4716870.1 hypothetical protein [Halapricum hydrolyticum]MCU4725525.1 hypothetical protein [Halapricum hydrolyticum]
MVSNPLNGARQKMAEKAMSQVTPSETAVAQAVVGTLTGYEMQQTQALVELNDAADVDVDLEYDRERRAQTLLSLADAVADRDVRGWWFRTIGPELMDQPEKAQQYVGLDADEYRETLEDWYRQYYERGVVDTSLDEADRERIGWIAENHVQTVFDLSLREFLELVVNWDRGEQIQPVLGGPIERNNAVIRQVAEEIDE